MRSSYSQPSASSSHLQAQTSISLLKLFQQKMKFYRYWFKIRIESWNILFPISRFSYSEFLSEKLLHTCLIFPYITKLPTELTGFPERILYLAWFISNNLNDLFWFMLKMPLTLAGYRTKTRSQNLWESY